MVFVCRDLVTDQLHGCGRCFLMIARIASILSTVAGGKVLWYWSTVLKSVFAIVVGFYLSNVTATIYSLQG